MTLHGKEEQNINEAILQAVASMPTGGGYATTPFAMRRLDQAVSICDGSLVVHPSIATPSFCSEATYLVFLKTLLLLQGQKKLFLSASTLAALAPHHEADGQGFWGCWNANGPGVARLFYTLGLGSNFTDLTAAEPGDFLKIFWNDDIGAAEHGHLVIYLGTEKKRKCHLPQLLVEQQTRWLWQAFVSAFENAPSDFFSSDQASVDGTIHFSC